MNYRIIHNQYYDKYGNPDSEYEHWTIEIEIEKILFSGTKWVLLTHRECRGADVSNVPTRFSSYVRAVECMDRDNPRTEWVREVVTE